MMKIKYINFRLMRSGVHETSFVKDELLRKPKNLIVIEVIYFLFGFFITAVAASALYESVLSEKNNSITIVELVVIFLILMLGLVTCYAAIQLGLENAKFRKLFLFSALAIIVCTFFSFNELYRTDNVRYLVVIDGSLIVILSIIFLYPPNRKYYEWTKLHS